MNCIQVSKTIIIQPQGRLDRSNAAVLYQWICDILLSSPALCVLDLADIDFMDSSGLLSLVAGLKAARQQRCRLVICNLQSAVQMILEIAQLDQVFDIFDSFEAILVTLV